MIDIFDLTDAEYQIIRAIAQLQDDAHSVDSVIAQLRAYLSQETNEKQTKNEQLAQELATIQTELRQLGRMMTKESDQAKNHQIAIYQHVERIINEIEEGK